jgi:Replication factor-A protein 1, N-terminal domain
VLGKDVPCPVVFQVVGSRKIASNGADAKNRYRLVISDGELIHSFAMLSVELNHMYESNQFPDNTIIKVGRYTCSVVNRSDNAEK